MIKTSKKLMAIVGISVILIISIVLFIVLNNKDDVKIGILVGAYSVTDRLEYYVDKETRDTYFQPIIAENMIENR